MAPVVPAGAAEAPSRRLALVVASTAMLSVAVDLAWFDAASASLQTLLGFGAVGASTALAGYALVGAASLIVAGSLADRHGWRVLTGWGIPSLAAAQLLSVGAAGPAMLVAGRMLAGAGAGVVTVAALVAFASAYPEDLRTRPYAIAAAAAAAAYVLVPSAAGLLISQPYWRVTPLIAVLPLAVLAALVSRVAPPTPASSRERLDIAGLLLAVFATCAAYGAIAVVPSRGLGAMTMVSGLVALVALSAFVRHEQRLRRRASGPRPLIDLGLFAVPTFTGAVAAAALIRFGTGAAFLFIVQLSQFVVGITPLATQLALIPAALTGIGGDLVSPTLERWFGTAGAIATGTLVLAVGYVGLIATTSDTYAIAFAAVALIAFGFESTVAPINRAVVSATDDDDHGSAVSAATTLAKLASVLGLATVTAVFLAVYAGNLSEQLRPGDLATSVSVAQVQTPAGIPAVDEHLAAVPRLQEAFDERAAQAYLSAQRIAFLIPALAAVGAGLVALATVRPSLARRQRERRSGRDQFGDTARSS